MRNLVCRVILPRFSKVIILKKSFFAKTVTPGCCAGSNFEPTLVCGC
jgi:hypothetical protein